METNCLRLHLWLLEMMRFLFPTRASQYQPRDSNARLKLGVILETHRFQRRASEDRKGKKGDRRKDETREANIIAPVSPKAKEKEALKAVEPTMLEVACIPIRSIMAR